jgi:serine/threonine-protein kinase RsbW
MNTIRPAKEKRPPRTTFAGIHRSNSLLELEVWMPSEIEAITPTVEPLMRVIESWRCSEGNEFAVELGLREALNNAVLHGNGTDPNKLVEVRCRIERGKGVWLMVKDQGKGFDPNAVPDPLAAENLLAEHGRGIQLMKLMMDEVSFQHGGTEVHMRKVSPRKLRPAPPRDNERVFSGPAEGLECEAVPVKPEYSL